MLNELLGDLLLSDAATAPEPAPASAGNAQNEARPNSLADLSDIFSSALAESEEKHHKQQSSDAFQPLPGGELLEPQVLVPRKNSGSSNGDAGDSLANGTGQSLAAGQGKRSSLNRKMPAIDMLSEELFQQVLPASQERMSSFKRDPEKLTLNDLVRERMQVKPTEQQPAGAAADAPDDVPLLSSVADSKKQEEKTAEAEPAAEQLPTAPAPKEVKHLSEICIELDNIQATGEERVVLDDDDMHLSLNFTEDRPSRHVSVIVIAAQNKSRQPVKDFQFEASVKKVKQPLPPLPLPYPILSCYFSPSLQPCKVRLLPPTADAMAPHKPFRPATINQVMLLLNPTGKPVDITCIVGYKLGDDPDPIKESIVAKDVAYVE